MKKILLSILPLLTLIVSTLVLTALVSLPIYLPLIFATIVAGAIAIFAFKYTYVEVMDFISESIKKVTPAILILLSIGILSASFMYSGIVPSIMYYASKIVSPSIYLPTIMITTAIISIAIGSSFTSIVTIGLALFSAGYAQGFDPGILAGAIVSGAMFGDKLSPLSDTTNISAMLARTTLDKHIKNMFSDTIIAFVLSIIVFTIIGFNTDISSTSNSLVNLQGFLEGEFIISPLLAIIPLIIILFINLKIPVIPSILLMSLVAVFISVFVQGYDLTAVLAGVSQHVSLAEGTEYESLLSRGGFETMLPTVSIVLLAASFGGILRFSKMFENIISPLSFILDKPKPVMITSLLSSAFVAIASGEQYLSIMLPSETFVDKFKDLNIKPENLSRCSESGGTVVIALVPWGVLAVFVQSVFEIDALTFIPFTFFCIFTPLVTIIRIIFTKTEKLLNS